MSAPYSIVPGFIDGTQARLFTIEYSPDGPERGTVLFVPPFGEEMNRSRRMMAIQCRLLAERGFRVVLPDLTGTGDSYGALVDTDWQVWIGDLARVISVHALDNDCELTCIAVRLGALLCMSAISGAAVPADRVVLWSPCRDGASFMNQFLRLKMLSALTGKSSDADSPAALKAELERGRAVEVAGYELAPSLYRAIAAADLADMLQDTQLPVAWLEMAGEARTSMPIASANFIDRVRSGGCDIEAQAIPGPKFWATVETTFSPELAARTLDCLSPRASAP